MTNPKRLAATVVYLVCLVATLVGGSRNAAGSWIARDRPLHVQVLVFTIRIRLLIVVAVVVQFLALAWYCITYIPYGRHMARRWGGAIRRVDLAGRTSLAVQLPGVARLKLGKSQLTRLCSVRTRSVLIWRWR